MFDLERHLAEWRKTAEAGEFRHRTDLVDELEDHLRSRFARFTLDGMPAEQAFDRSVAGLGRPGELAGEFGKLSAGRSPLRFLHRGSLALQMLSMALVVLMAVLGRWPQGISQPIGWLLTAHVWAITAGYMAMLMAGLTASGAIVLRLLRPLTPGEVRISQRHQARQTAFALVTILAGLLLGMVWSQSALGRAWSFDPREVGGAGLVCWTAVIVARDRFKPRPEPWLLATALGGSLLTLLAWLVPPMLRHQEGFAAAGHAFSSGLTVFGVTSVVLHGVLGVLAVLPPAPGRRRLT